MRFHRSVWTVALACAVAACAAPAFGQGGKDDQKAMMEAMARAGAPGPEHKQLAVLAGSWTTEVKMWMGPGEPSVSKGASENAAIFGGRYVKQDYKGEFMGQPFDGMGLTGYDNTLKKYVATWADSGSTGIMRMTGTYDAAAKTYTFEGVFPDPASGQEKPTKMALRVVSNDQHVMEWWDPLPDGKWVKVMEITYTRK